MRAPFQQSTTPGPLRDDKRRSDNSGAIGEDEPRESCLGSTPTPGIPTVTYGVQKSLRDPRSSVTPLQEDPRPKKITIPIQMKQQKTTKEQQEQQVGCDSQQTVWEMGTRPYGSC